MQTFERVSSLCVMQKRIGQREAEEDGRGTPKILENQQIPNKRASSVGGIPRFRFLAHMAMLTNRKSALEMAWGARLHSYINKNLDFR